MVPTSRVTVVALAALVVVLAAAGAMFWTSATLLLALGTLLTTAVFLAPKPALATVGLFLLVQTPIVNLAGGRDSALGLTLQRAPEALLLAALVRVVVLGRDLRLGSRLRRWVWLAGGFGVAGLTSSVVNQVPWFVTMLGGFLALKFVLLVLVALTIRWTPNDARTLLRWMLWLGPVLLLISIVLLSWRPDELKLFADPAALQEGYFQRGALRPLQGPFPNPGVFGWLMAVVGCYAVAAGLGGQRAAGGAALGSSVAGILGSLRRKPLVGLPLAALTVVWGTGNRRQRWAIAAMLAALGVGAIVVAPERLTILVEDTRSTYLDPYAPTTARALLYVVGWQVARDQFPLGAGFGRYGGYVSAIRYSPLYDRYGLSRVWGLSPEFPAYVQDTYWPHLLGETGLFGTLFMALVLLELWICLGRVARTAVSHHRALALAAGMALVEAVVESLSGPVFETTLQALILAVPIGMTLSLSEAQSPPPSADALRQAEGVPL